MVILFTILGIVANVAHALAAWWMGRIDTLQVILAIFATSLFPLSVALVTHLVKRVIARGIERAATVQTLAELCLQLETRRADLDRLNGQIERTQEQLSALKNEAKQLFVQPDGPSMALAREVKQAKIDTRRASVLSLLSEGMEPKDIASELNVTVRTIKRDITALNGKAQVML